MDSDRVVAVRVVGVQRVIERRFKFRIPVYVARPLVSHLSIAEAVGEVEKRLAVRRVGLDRDRSGQFAAWQAARDAILENGEPEDSSGDFGVGFEAVYGKLVGASRRGEAETGELEIRLRGLVSHLEESGSKYRRFVRKINRLRKVRRDQVRRLFRDDGDRRAVMDALDRLFCDVLRRANEFAFELKDLSEDNRR